ncbi:VOC family protein [Kitasatospora putterlickiae]|uniref:VOC family protein n=1 Tax=Kitasatospora putterlickiae TaxID=221725 RepID=A0ABN1YEM2_9ACTN
MPKAGRYHEGVPCWVELGAVDPGRARRFYGALFGWEFVDLPGRTVATLRGAQVAGLTTGPAGSAQAWTTYLAVTDAARTAEAVREAGGRVLREPYEVPPEQGWAALAADPAGAVFGLRQGLLWQGAGLVDEPAAFSWSEQHSPDPDTARAFYQRVFGYAYGREADGATLFRVDGQPAGGIARGPDAGWAVHFGTADTDLAVQRVRELGGTVPAGPEPTPFGRRAVVRDDGGAAFTLVGLPSAERTPAA